MDEKRYKFVPFLVHEELWDRCFKYKTGSQLYACSFWLTVNIPLKTTLIPLEIILLFQKL